MNRDLFDRLWASMRQMDEMARAPIVDKVMERLMTNGEMVREHVPGVGYRITYQPHRIQGTADL